MEERLWRFIDNCGTFEFKTADKIKNLYFPLTNERLMSSLSPDLHGDIKTGQNSFLLAPVSRIDLINLRVSRNFWIYINPVKNIRKTIQAKIFNGVNKDKVWSVTGVSKDLKQIQEDRFHLESGLLWHKVNRENKNIGLRVEILSFVPATGEPVEIMQVGITNITAQNIEFVPTAAIPIYGRSANNLRDHRQVTSLLQRISLHKSGVITRPLLIFDESGHRPNKTQYFVLGWDEKFNPPQYIYPTQEMFCGEEGDLEAPMSILKNLLPKNNHIQGKEAMGALRFRKITLAPNESHYYIILMGIVEEKTEIKKIINKFNSLEKIKASLKQTKDFWVAKSNEINLSTGNSDFDNWLRWMSIQPTLRKIFGCSFLPDFDYGKGGRGWRDLWQDLLSLILNHPSQVRKLLINNFRGVRIDGSNATLIGRGEGEFISDRNSISRVWMDHGTWPLLTLDLYLNETADYNILFEQTAYFRNHEINRARNIDPNWNPAHGNKLMTSSGKIYKGTVLEHLLVQNLVQFFNVGSHNHIRLEDADWNDGLDMAKENGESVAFSCMYAYTFRLLSQLLERIDRRKIKIAKECKILLSKINYNSIKEKHSVLKEYFTQTESCISEKKISLDSLWLSTDLRLKSEWMTRHIRKTEWLKEGFFNGYYDNQCQRVEGYKHNTLRMMLASQVFPIISGIADDDRIKRILKNVQKYLWDKKLKGYHLNTDFSRTSFKTSGGAPPKAGKKEQHNLGRAFSFVYGDKENGAFFNHMVVMFAYALYKRGYALEGWQVLNSIYNMAIDTAKSKIYPCLPEYFNLEGRGMYSYLTGSASWFVLTILTEVFGLKGKEGDLLVEPKLFAEQFKSSSTLTIKRIFNERKLEVNFSNPKRLTFGKYRIVKASLNSSNLALSKSPCIIVPRKTILCLPQDKINTLNIVLG